MSSDYDIQRGTFAYISCYLESKGENWSLDNPPRCGDSTFTFDSRNADASESSPLVTIHSWEYKCDPPSDEDLRAISSSEAEDMKKYVLALQTKRESIISANQMRTLLSLSPMSKSEIISLVE